MGEPKNLNQPQVYAEALVQAAFLQDSGRLAAWLADDENIAESPFSKWYTYFADRLIDMAPKPELGFQPRPMRAVPQPKIGRNDICPCGSGKKFKQCHLGKEEAVGWKLGSPTPVIRAHAVARIIQESSIESLNLVPRNKASDVALTEMAATYQRHGHMNEAIKILAQVLNGERENPYLLWDYWIARYAEWLVESDRTLEGEQFLLNEYDTPRGVMSWQVAQKLAAFYIDQDDSENADIWVNTALEGQPDNPFNYYLKGLLNHSLENWQEAEDAYGQALTLSGGFRQEEKAYMEQLVNEGLHFAKNRLPISAEEVNNSIPEKGEQP